MSRGIHSLVRIYGASCIMCTPFVLPQSFKYIWNDIHGSFKHKNSDTVLFTTAISASVVPAIVLWSPVIAVILTTR